MQILKRFNYEEELNELIEENIIKNVDGKIQIDFLDNQREAATKLAKKNSENGRKGGRPKTQKKPKENPKETQTKGIRQDEMIQDEMKQDECAVEKHAFTPEEFLKWFNSARTRLLEKPSHVNFLSHESKVHLEILTKRYTGKDFGKALHNICNDKWANESNNIMPKHFLNPEQFTKYLDMEFKPTITKKQKQNRGWAI